MEYLLISVNNETLTDFLQKEEGEAGSPPLFLNFVWKGSNISAASPLLNVSRLHSTLFFHHLRFNIGGRRCYHFELLISFVGIPFPVLCSGL